MSSQTEIILVSDLGTIDDLLMNFQEIMMSLLGAIFANDDEAVSSILDRYPELSFEGGPISPLWVAASKGHPRIVELIIRAGANVNEIRHSESKTDGMRLYLLHWLANVTSFKCLDGHLEVAEILIKHGADVNKLDKYYDDTPVSLALGWNNLKWAECMLKNGANITAASVKSTYRFDYMMGSVLKRQKPDIRREMLKLLFDHGLDAKFRNKKGKNLFHIFIKKNASRDDPIATEIAQMLYDKGVPFDECDNEGYSPLFLTIRKQNVSMLKFLIEKGADVNRIVITTRNTKTFPLHCTTVFKNEGVVRALLSAGAKVNTETNSGETSLHLACLFFNYHVIDILIQNGAELSPEDNNGKTPFSLLDPREYDYNKCLCAMIKQFSIHKYENISIHKNDMDMILEKPQMRQHLENCTKELDLMKITKFYGPYSYYSIYKMSKNLKKLANLTKNKKFVVSFKAGLSKFSYYQSDLRRILKEAVEKQKKQKTVFSRLRYIFQDMLPTVVIRNMTKYLTKMDLPMN